MKHEITENKHQIERARIEIEVKGARNSWS